MLDALCVFKIIPNNIHAFDLICFFPLFRKINLKRDKLTYFFVKQVSIIVYIVCQQTGLRANQKGIRAKGGVQDPCCQATDCLINVQKRNIRVLGTKHQTVGTDALTTCMGIMNKNL